jgi:predicted N-acyltransferase
MMAGTGWLSRLARYVGKFVPALVYYKILFCGTPLSAGQSHLRFAPDADRRAAFDVLDDLLQRVARQDRAACIVLKEFGPEELPGLETAERLGYQRADSLPMNDLRIEQGTWDQYLAGLDEKRRWKVRRSRKKLTAGGLQVVITSDRNEVERRFTNEVHRLYQAVAIKADMDFIQLPAEFFRELARQLPGHCDYLFVLEGDAVRAFGVCLYSGTAYNPLFMGVDYERNHDHDLYFNILYETIVAALRHNVRNIRFGQNADQVKRERLACQRTPRYFFIKGANLLLQVVLRLFSTQLFPPHPILAAGE